VQLDFDQDHPQNKIGKLKIDEQRILHNPRVDSGLLESRFGDSVRFDFTDNITGWTANVGSTVSHDSVNGWLNYTWTIDDPQIYYYSASFLAASYPIIRARLKVNNRIEKTSEWNGDFFWGRSAEGFDASRKLSVIEPPQNMGDPFFEMNWDMENETDWDGTITDLRFDFYGASGSTGSLDIDWIRAESKVL